jgi:hypothetical protein
VLSPMMTVFVLAVLWLIVVVPMVVRRNDERRRDRSVDGFGRAMRALGQRNPAGAGAGAGAQRSEVFVPRERRAASPATATRRPVPAAQEALMYPVDRSEMSAARAQMMARRRRSLSLLIVGVLVSIPTAVLMGGGVLWFAAAPFILGLAGYLYFLRSQALRDRDRRVTRQIRAAERLGGGYDVTADLDRHDGRPESLVRIDDDDLELHNLDTVDLTGLYNEELGAAVAQRRAS